MVETYSLRIGRENSGHIPLEKTLKGIRKLRVTQLIFLHGKRIKKSKKAKKKKRTDDDSSSEDPLYENANEELMDAVYLELLINKFIRGTILPPYESDRRGNYTIRFPVLTLDPEEGGIAAFEKEGDVWDWEGEPKDISSWDVVLMTDKNPDITDYSAILELQVER